MMNAPEVTLLYPHNGKYLQNMTNYQKYSSEKLASRIQTPISTGLATPRFLRSNKKFHSFGFDQTPQKSLDFSKKTISFDEDPKMIDVKRTSELFLDRIAHHNVSLNLNFNQSSAIVNNQGNGAETKRKILQFFSKMRRTKSSTKLNYDPTFTKGFCWNESMIDMESSMNQKLNYRVNSNEKLNSFDEYENPLQVLYQHLNLNDEFVKKSRKVFPIIQEVHPSILSERLATSNCAQSSGNDSHFLISNVSRSSNYNDSEIKPQTTRIDKVYSCKESEIDSWISGLCQYLDPDYHRKTRDVNKITLWIQEIKSFPKNKKYFCTVTLDNILVARTPTKKMTDMLLFNEKLRIPVNGRPSSLRIDVWNDPNEKSESIRSQDQSEGFSKVNKADNQNDDQLISSSKRFSVPTSKDLSDEMNDSERNITCSTKLNRKKKKSKKYSRKHYENGKHSQPILYGYMLFDLDKLPQNGDEYEEWINLTPSLTYQVEQNQQQVQTRKSFSLITQSSPSSPTTSPIQIRFRIKQRLLSVMTSYAYKELLEYFTPTENKNLLETLIKFESTMSLKEKTELASLILDIHKYTSNFKAILSELIVNNIDNTTETSLILRGNSLATKAMEIYIKTMANNYLKVTLGDIFKTLFEQSQSNTTPKKIRQRSSSQNNDHLKKLVNENNLVDPVKLSQDCEIDPSRISSSGTKNLELILAKNRQNLTNFVQIIWNRIFHSQNYFPKELQEIFSEIRCKLCLSRLNLKRKPEVNNNQLEDPEIMSLNAISSCIFLRFICPAILNPYLFGLVDSIPENSSLMRTLTLAAKIIQSLANLCLLNSSKEDYMSCMNTFVSSKMNQMKHFLRVISTSPDLEDSNFTSAFGDDGDSLKKRFVSSKSMHTGLQTFNVDHERDGSRHLAQNDSWSKTTIQNRSMTNSVMTFNERNRQNNKASDLSSQSTISNNYYQDEGSEDRNEILAKIDLSSCPIVALPECPKIYKCYSNSRSLALASCHVLLCDIFKKNPRLETDDKLSELLRILEKINFRKENPEEMNEYLLKSRIFSIKESFPMIKPEKVDYLEHKRPLMKQEVVGESIYDLPLVTQIDKVSSESDFEMIGNVVEPIVELRQQKIVEQQLIYPYRSVSNYQSPSGMMGVQAMNKSQTNESQRMTAYESSNGHKFRQQNIQTSNYIDTISTSGYQSGSNNRSKNISLDSPTTNGSSHINTGLHLNRENLEYDETCSLKNYKGSIYSNNSPLNQNHQLFLGHEPTINHEFINKAQPSHSKTSYCVDKNSPTIDSTISDNNSSLQSSSASSSNSRNIRINKDSAYQHHDNHMTRLSNNIIENEKMTESQKRLALTRLRLIANEQEHRELIKTLQDELRRQEEIKYS